MKPILLEVSAWGPYRGRERVDFSAMCQGGLFLVTGPTGAGKTSVFDGICYALFGEVSGTTREKDSMRSDFAESDTETCVTLTFVHQGKQYVAKRSPRYDRPKLRGTGVTTVAESGTLFEGEHVLATGAAQMTEAVETLLGMNYRQFKQISMVAQGEFMQLLLAPSKERTRIFRDIFETSLYDRVTQRLAERVKVLTQQLDELKNRSDERVSVLTLQAPEWEQIREKKDRNMQQILELAAKEQKESAGLAKKMDQELGELTKEKDKLQNHVEQLRTSNRLIREYEEGQKQLSLRREELKEALIRFEKLKEEAKGLEGLEQQAEQFSKELTVVKEEIVTLQKLTLAKQRLEQLQKAYLELDTAAKKAKQEYEWKDDCRKKAAAGILASELEEGMPCPVCGSTEHPQPARLLQEVVSEQELNRSKVFWEQAAARAEAAQAEAAAANGSVKTWEQKLSTGHEGEAALKDRQQELVTGERNIRKTITELRDRYHRADVEQAGLLAACTQLEQGLRKPENLTLSDLTLPEEQLRDMGEKTTELLRARTKLVSRVEDNARILTKLKEYLARREKLEQEYGVLRKTERAASGYNNRNLVLEQYVLSSYFDEILEAANRRLKMMSGQRYELFRIDGSRDRRMKESMELEVLDCYTGKRRSVKTLSGGESFKAALALALGTSDVVQSYASGMQVETLFVDEGFGALDEESLAQAVDILSSLGDGNRMIGIISHVEELKERIESQIIIKKTNNGSSIQCSLMI